MPASRSDLTVPASALRDVRLGITSAQSGGKDSPAMIHLRRLLGPMWQLREYPGNAELIAALRAGDVDLGWLSPIAYARAARSGAADLVLSMERTGVPAYSAALIARDVPEASGPEYVRRKRAVWVDAWSASGYLVPRQMLRRAGLDPERAFASQSFVGSHPAVVDAVARNAADVGATWCSVDANGTIVKSAWEGQKRVKALAVSSPIAGDTIAASAALGVRDGERIAARLRELSDRADARPALLAAFGADRFVPGDPRRYASLEEALDHEPG